jgi:hypothetical protein
MKLYVTGTSLFEPLPCAFICLFRVRVKQNAKQIGTGHHCRTSVFLFLLPICRVSVHGDRPVPKTRLPENRGEDHDDQCPVSVGDHAVVENEDQGVNIREHAAADCEDKNDILNKMPTFPEELKYIFPAIVINEEDQLSR